MSFDLQRFVDAQAQTFARAFDEIRDGEKRSHWMWYIFPQVAGLGHSAMARRYAIRSLGEARAYLDHPVLGPRYEQCVEVLQALPDGPPERVFGAIDAAKLRSSLTLFEAAGGPDPVSAALDRWYDGARDTRTLELLAAR